MAVVKVWLLVIYGVTATNSETGRTYRGPLITVDNLVSKEQCVALGKRLTENNEYLAANCTGIDKVSDRS